MQFESDRKIISCPYCGAIVKEPETALDLEKFREKTRRQNEARDNKKDIIIVIILGVIAVTIFLLAYVHEIGPHYQRMHQLDAIIEEIYDDIANNDYDSAAIKVTKIRLSDGYSDDDEARYENIRKDLEELIKKGK